jgi:hypothetical protein
VVLKATPAIAIAAIGAVGATRWLLSLFEARSVATKDSVPAAKIAAAGPWVARIMKIKMSAAATATLA